MSFATAARRALTRRKPLHLILSDERSSRNTRSSASSPAQLLGLFDLLCIGVGGTIGSGVFVLTGSVYPKAGPSACLSWLFSAVICCFSALSYCELSSKIPTKGSCYIFAYASLGELFAVVGAVCLTLEYAVAGAGIATSWSQKLATLVGTDLIVNVGGLKLDFVAAALEATCVCVCLCKLELGKNLINIMTLMKVLLVLILILAGVMAATFNPSEYNTDIFSFDDFFPRGIGGMISGTSLLFFGFIGFDEVCCMAGKAANPKKVMPKAILGTLLIAAVCSMSAQFSLTLMSPWSESMEDTSFEDAFDARGWVFLRWLTAIGEIVLLPLVCLVSFLPEPELLAAMSEDKLLPSFLSFQNHNEIFVNAGRVAGVALVLVSLLVPFSILWDVISLGVLLSFNLTNTSLIMMRCGNGGELISSKKVRMWCFLLWVFGGCGSYLIYFGLKNVLFYDNEKIVTLDDDEDNTNNDNDDNNERVNWMMTSIGIACVSVGMLCMAMISKHKREKTARENSIEAQNSTFTTPFVPYIPGFAIILNFFLAASFSLDDHIFLFSVLAFAIGVYSFYKLTKRIGIANKLQRSDITRNASNDANDNKKQALLEGGGQQQQGDGDWGRSAW